MEADPQRLCDGTVLTRLERGVLTVTLNRPEVHNAITAQQLPVLTGVMNDASESLDVRVVVLTGAGGHFSTGADLRSTAGFGRGPRPPNAPAQTVGEIARMIRRGWQQMVASVLDCEKPVVAAVAGNVAGGSLPLALACDLIVAAESAKLNCVFARRGLVPDAGAAYLLPRLIGPQRAKQLAFFAEPVSASDALQMGLVNRVVPDGELDDEVREYAGRLAAGPTKAIAFAKHLLNRSLESDRTTAFFEESLMQEMVIGSQDTRAAGIAFAERREAPEFHGW